MCLCKIIVWGKQLFACTKRILAAAALAVFAMSSTVTAANAAPVKKLSESDITFINQSSERLGISPSAKNKIIRNLERGIVPQSVTGEGQVSETKTVRGDTTVFRRVFSDGSVSESSFKDISPATVPASNDVTPRSVTGCSDSWVGARIRFIGCDVRTDQALFTLAFKTDGYMGSACISSAQASEVTRASGAWYSGVGSASLPVSEILVQRESCGRYAMARASTNVQTGLYSFTASVTFRVGGGFRNDVSP